MDQIFDNFFEDVFNKDQKNGINAAKLNNNTDNIVKTTVFDSNNNQKSLEININPASQRFEKPFDIEKINTNLVNEIMNPNIIKAIEGKIAKNDFEVEKNINKLDEKINGNKVKVQNELLVEKQKYIKDSIKEDENHKNLNNEILNKKENEQLNSYDAAKDSNAKSKSDSENLINKITLNENLTKILNVSSTAKLVKYAFYFGILIVICMLALLFVKFCIAAKDFDKPIKTKHSINEIEDELNAMKGRDKLFQNKNVF